MNNMDLAVRMRSWHGLCTKRKATLGK